MTARNWRKLAQLLTGTYQHPEERGQPMERGERLANVLIGVHILRRRPGACAAVLALISLLAIASCWGVSEAFAAGAVRPIEDPLAEFPASRRGSAEIWGPVVLMHLTGVQPVGEKAQAHLRSLVVKHAPGPRWFGRLGTTQGSWNTPVIDGAVMLWAGLPPARGDWVRFFRLQLREEAATAETRYLGLLGGSESLSANYAPWRAGAIAAVWTWAIRRGDVELAGLARRWSTTAAALAALVSTDQFPDRVGVNRRGERLDTGRIWTSPVSHRSNLAHADPQNRLLLSLVLGESLEMRRPPEWFIRLARAANDERPILEPGARATLRRYLAEPMAPGAAEAVCALVNPSGIHGAIRVLHWPGYRAVLLEERLNGNTPVVQAEGHDLARRESVLAYPYPPGRAFNAKGRGTAIWAGGKILAVSPFSSVTIPTPANDPAVAIRISGEGCVVTRRAA